MDIVHSANPCGEVPLTPKEPTLCVCNQAKGGVLKLRAPTGEYVYARPGEDIEVMDDWRARDYIKRGRLMEVPRSQRIVHEVHDY
jgi:hypothetical protein